MLSPRVIVWLAICGFIVYYFFGGIWSTSVDLAHHYALVARLTEYGPSVNDPMLGEMNVYPRGSHLLAAIFAKLSASPFAGMQLVSLISLVVLWSAIAFALHSLPRQGLRAVSAIWLTLLIVNHWLIRAEIHGHEIIDNFFFPQFVAQAMTVTVIALAMFSERRGTNPLQRYLLIAAAILVIEEVHLLPALELLGFVALLVALDSWLTARELRLQAMTAGLALVVATIALVVVNPTFDIMRGHAEKSGGLALRHISGLAAIGALCLAVGLMSGALLFQWLRAATPEARRNTLVIKYVGLYGLAISGLCGLQCAMVALEHGEEYVCRKYAFGLFTLLLLDLALLSAVHLRPKWFLYPKPAAGPLWRVFDEGLLALFVLASSFAAFPAQAKVWDVSTLLSVEKFARAYMQTREPNIPGKADYAVDIAGLSSTENYLISIGVLKAPRSASAYAILFERPLSEPDAVDRILTSEHGKPWDVVACRRRGVSAESLVVLDGACVLGSFKSDCAGAIDFSRKGALPFAATRGFSHPEAEYRWSDGGEASFTCKFVNGTARPTKARIATHGFVPKGHKQRMLISVNGGEPRVIVYDKEWEAKTIELNLPGGGSEQLRFRFAFPDAVSPKELGLSADERKIGVGFRAIEFE